MKPSLSQAGIALMEVLVAVGITMVLASALATQFGHQAQENRAVSERMGAMDLYRTISSALVNPATCDALIAPGNLSAPTFDSAALPVTLSAVNVPSGGTAAPLAIPNTVATSLTSSLRILPDGVHIVVDSVTPPRGRLIVKFDQTRLVRPVHDLEFDLNLNITGPTATTSISSCLGTLPTPESMCAAVSGTWNYTTGRCDLAQPTGAQLCALLGPTWTWDGVKCAQSGAAMCAAINGTWDGTTCTPGSGAPGPIPPGTPCNGGGVVFYGSGSPSGTRVCCAPGISPMFSVGGQYFSYMFCDAY